MNCYVFESASSLFVFIFKSGEKFLTVQFYMICGIFSYFDRFFSVMTNWWTDA